MYGCTDTAPGGQPDLAGPASANLTYQPILCSGVDASPAIGFQPVFGCGDLAIVAPATANVDDVVAGVAVGLGVGLTRGDSGGFSPPLPTFGSSAPAGGTGGTTMQLRF